MNSLEDIALNNEAALHQSAFELVATVRALSLEESQLKIILRLVRKTIRRAFESSRIVSEEVQRLRGISRRIEDFQDRDRNSTRDHRPAHRQMELASPIFVM